MSTPPDTDPQFADLLDELLDQVLNGEEPDLAGAAARHAGVADRVAEAFALASSLAGRKVSARPTLQGYEIDRELGRGGMGTVYLARQKALDRKVAIKVLPHSFGLSAESRRRFLEEARALARIRHEHIVTIHRIVDDGELLAFEMEYVDGPSLHTLLATLRERRERTGAPAGIGVVAELLGVPVEQLGARSLTQFFVRLLLKVARALAAVHAAGFVHRDIKPANLLLRQNGDPVVVDFGLVRLRNLEASHAGRFAGTPVYSAPEQLRGDVLVGPPADVYSLGVTLYECLTLSTPFAGRTTTDLLQRIEAGQFRPLRRLAPDAPRDLETIVVHAMDVDARQRYPDAGAFADDLQRLLELHPIRARPVHPARRFGKLLRRNRRPLLAAAAGAVLVAAVLFPVLHRVEARGRAHADALAHVRAARAHLVEVDAVGGGSSYAIGRGGARRRLQTTGEHNEPLRAALAEYERALALAPDADDARREHDVVRLAIWLSALTVSQPGAVDEALQGAEFAAITARLGPATVRAAVQLAHGPAAAPDAAAAAPADDGDRLTLGLLAYLLGDLPRCEAAWANPRAQLADLPLVDAGLGRLLLSDGMLEPAYARLLPAQRHFPECATLTLELADTALRLGDLDLARDWLARMPEGADRSPRRDRIELDLRAAATSGAELVADYEALAQQDPNDPTPQYRLAQLALRRGDLREAALRLDALLRDWPEAAEFRLERARIALQRRDLPAYARQVLAVLDRDCGRGRSRGTAANLLEILRLGGLEGLYVDGLAQSGAQSAGRALFGGELPIQGFAAPALARHFEELARFVHGVRRDAAAVCGAGHRLDDASAWLLVAVPLAIGRLPLGASLSPTARALLAAAPHVSANVYEYWQPWARALLVRLPFGNRWPVDLERIERPADLPDLASFGSLLLRTDDHSGDGVADLLLACGVRHPEAAQARVLLIDGASGAVFATTTGSSRTHMFGHALAVVDDLDGDGEQDWLVGCPAGTPNEPAGLVEVWSGRLRARLAVVRGSEPGFGVSVAGLGDCDGDGVPDFVVGNAPLLRNSAAQGSVHVVSGRTFAVLATRRNDVPGVWYGAALAAVGDADGDGCTDFAVGGNFGGELSGPGLVQLCSGRTRQVLQAWSDASTATGFGHCVAAAGDVDGDGRADVLVSAVGRADAAQPDRVFVYSGRTGAELAALAGKRPGSGFGHAAVRYGGAANRTIFAIGVPDGGDPATGQVELWSVPDGRITTTVGANIGGGFGWSLALRDDTDGDGLPELFVAEPSANRNGMVWSTASRQLLRQR